MPTFPEWVRPQALIHYKPDRVLFFCEHRIRRANRLYLVDASGGQQGREYWLDECEPANYLKHLNSIATLTIAGKPISVMRLIERNRVILKLWDDRTTRYVATPPDWWPDMQPDVESAARSIAEAFEGGDRRGNTCIKLVRPPGGELMPVLSYQPWKAAKVESGECRPTIRRIRKRPIEVGDTLYHWEKQRTPQRRKLGESVCIRVTPIDIGGDGLVFLEGRFLSPKEVQELAIADGFNTVENFLNFFVSGYGTSFDGVVIGWEELIKPIAEPIEIRRDRIQLSLTEVV